MPGDDDDNVDDENGDVDVSYVGYAIDDTIQYPILYNIHLTTIGNGGISTRL